MISPTVKHKLITDLDEARYTLTHLVDKTPDELAILDELNELMAHVVCMMVEGE